MNRTKIEWTDYTWNPITGCKHGCWYCYARKLAVRGFIKNNFEPTFYPERLKEPWNLKKPSKIFVCSVSDLFAPWTPEEWRDAILESIFECPVKHTFQLLTKNPERIPPIRFPNNIWVGATITKQAEAYKIMDLLQVDAKIKFASFEPLLEDISFCMEGIQWAIIGKLTGSKRIKLKREWVYNLLGQLKAHNIPVFMKFNLCPPLEKKELIQEFPSPRGTIINMWEHTSWGDNIYFFNWEKRHLVGWMTPIPNIGDEIRCKMKSGKVARFKIIKVEPQKDPKDMFFATVEDIGYLGGG